MEDTKSPLKGLHSYQNFQKHALLCINKGFILCKVENLWKDLMFGFPIAAVWNLLGYLRAVSLSYQTTPRCNSAFLPT